ncbi:MAG: hypothetical protein H7842_05905 [Gammaproteobacteria bacterium SHHR-1]|uniref:hypothetical protein n=1 Tax=Magnetovirga frankeli TaxID=947516 RepID=UPI0012932A8E|nr:hypothetical protein D5125_02515 [gamma proteobacterium SS-5]
MTQQQHQGQIEEGFEVVSDVVKVGQGSSKLAGLAGSGTGQAAGAGGRALGSGAAHHVGMAVGGGAGSGFFAGKATGLKLGLGLGGLGGPILLAAVCGAGGYALYRWAKQRSIPHTDRLVEK